MIQVIRQPDAALTRQVQAYLRSPSAAASGACGEHDPRWLSVLRQALGHDPYILLATSSSSPSPRGEGQEVTGYLPLALVASRLFGRFLVSLPYLNRAGVVADDEPTARALVSCAAELAGELDVQYLELRHGERTLAHEALTAKRDEKVRMLLELPADEDALMKLVGSKTRNLIRKGDKSELSVDWGGLDVLDDFYGVFAVNMRDLGTPVYPRKLFARVLSELAGDAELAVVRHKGQCIAGALLVHESVTPGGLTTVPSASSLRAFNWTNANMWMYKHLLLRAMARGNRCFDFGRSSVDSGTYNFKKQWGAQPVPTVWQYHVRRGDIGAVRPDSPKYRKRIETWQKMPVWLTRLLGPAIVRGIP